ncbi:hypothetical protein [Myxosarcina sp. GI1(2024)]
MLVGSSGVICHILGFALGNEYLNFVGALLGRSSAIVYLAALDKFRLYSLVPLAFAIANVALNDRVLLYLELASQGFIYQIIAFITFNKLNQQEKQS